MMLDKNTEHMCHIWKNMCITISNINITYDNTRKKGVGLITSGESKTSPLANLQTFLDDFQLMNWHFTNYI